MYLFGTHGSLFAFTPISYGVLGPVLLMTEEDMVVVARPALLVTGNYCLMKLILLHTYLEFSAPHSHLKSNCVGSSGT